MGKKRVKQEINLGGLFGQALEAMASHKKEINALDGYNGNHGDNMVENLGLITRALQEKESLPPAEALRHASQRLQSEGRGGTSQYYAKGLSKAASQLQDRSTLNKGDVSSLVQTLMSAVPAEGHPQQSEAGGSLLDVLGLLGGQQAQPQSQPQQQEEGVDIGDVLGLLGGQQAQPQSQPQQQEEGVDMGDVLEVLLPAGAAFLQAKQSGADTTTAAGQALMGALTGASQANTPRAASGSIIAQSLLKALTK